MDYTGWKNEIINGYVDAFDKRPRSGEPWVGIIIHHTGVGDRDIELIDEALWRRLYKNITAYMSKKDDTYISAHYHIGRFGECTELVNPDSHIAYHAGRSSFWHPMKRRFANGWNEYAIGIELLGDGNRGLYSDMQYEKLILLVRHLLDRFKLIDPQCIVGHEVISPGRKDDPGKFFDWQRLYKGIYAG